MKSNKVITCDLEALNSALRYCIVKVGIREISIPGELEFGILTDHIIQNYGNHTPDEIRLAFDMAISGRLNVDPVCYENFSCLYFSSIMNAYREWAGKVKDYIDRGPQPNNEKQIGYKPHWGEQVEYFYQQARKGVFVSYLTYPVKLYDQMVEDGFIQHNPLFTDGQKKEAVFLKFQKDKEWRTAFYEPNNP